jgi:hypothetical protein
MNTRFGLVNSRRELILKTVEELAKKFMFEDRNSDEDLPRGHIEATIHAREITVDEIVLEFRKKLETFLE